jgi:hypothetical protein
VVSVVEIEEMVVTAVAVDKVVVIEDPVVVEAEEDNLQP